MGSRLRKRERTDPPDKWNSEEILDYNKAEEQMVWAKERELADRLVKSLKKNGIDDVFKLDHLTKGEGNCFMISTMQQLRRKEVYNVSSPEIKEIAVSMNHRVLRLSVYKWVKGHITHPKIIQMKELYELDQDIKKDLGEVTKTWDEYWNHMLKDGIWADNWFVQATALFLGMDYWIMDTACNKKHPYFKVTITFFPISNQLFINQSFINHLFKHHLFDNQSIID